MRGDKGFALILTLLITAILVAVIAEAVYSVHSGALNAASARDTLRGAILADGGAGLAGKALKALNDGEGYTYLSPADSERVIPAGDGALIVRVEDEHSKLSLSIAYKNGELNEGLYGPYERLTDRLGLAKGLPEALSDWIDSDNASRALGGETNGWYGRLDPPYEAKNGPLDSVDELMLVKGYTPSVMKRLSPFVTAHTDGLVNINTAPKEVLRALSEEITDDMAGRVIAHRKRTPFGDTADIRKVVGFETLGFSLQGRITVKSDIFRIITRGEYAEGAREVESIVDVSSSKVLYRRSR